MTIPSVGPTALADGILFALTELMVAHARMHGDVELGLEAARKALDAGVAKCSVLQLQADADPLDLGKMLKPALDGAERTARESLSLPRVRAEGVFH